MPDSVTIIGSNGAPATGYASTILALPATAEDAIRQRPGFKTTYDPATRTARLSLDFYGDSCVLMGCNGCGTRATVQARLKAGAGGQGASAEWVQNLDCRPIMALGEVDTGRRLFGLTIQAVLLAPGHYDVTILYCSGVRGSMAVCHEKLFHLRD